ncbi:MAG: molybdopterin-dependent oxidoreductase [Azospirillaceae bacterium]
MTDPSDHHPPGGERSGDDPSGGDRSGADRASRLPPNQALASPSKWPVVGERAPRADDRPWTVSIGGLVERPQVFSLDVLQSLPDARQRIDIHCVTRWSKLDQAFTGVPLGEVLERAGVRPEARFVWFGARSEHGHATSLRLDEALAAGALVAFAHEDRPLAPEHGGPVRMVVPGKYFYKSIKWLETIELLAEDRLGTWESESGYHNHADPWAEERFVARNLDRLTVARAMSDRRFAGLDLLGVEADGIDLTGLDARGALLRNASFRGARLAGARFDEANLSGARLNGADLTGAKFTGADLEGADFRGADLSGADFTDASLFGTTLFPEPTDPAGGPGAARLDPATVLPGDVAERLSDAQRDGLRARGLG